MYGRFIERIVYSKDSLVLILKCEFSGVFTMCSVCSVRNYHSWLMETQVSCTPVWALGMSEMQFPDTFSFAGNCSVPSIMEDQYKLLQVSSKPNFRGDLSGVSSSHSLWSTLFTGTLTFQPPLPHNLDFWLLISMRMQNSSLRNGIESAYRQKA